jgi:hypothetical protein
MPDEPTLEELVEKIETLESRVGELARLIRPSRWPHTRARRRPSFTTARVMKSRSMKLSGLRLKSG